MPHIEFTREIARRFNHIYGREPGFEEKAEAAIKKLGSKRAKLYRELRTRYQEQGDHAGAGGRSRAARGGAEPEHGRPRAAVRLSRRRRQDDPVRARGAADRGLEDAGTRRAEDVQVVQQHHHACARMPTASRARSARCRPIPRACGAPIRATRRSARSGSSTWCTRTSRPSEWVQQGCRSAGIGCLECKQPVIDAVLRGAGADARARAGLSGRSDSGAQHHRGRLRPGAQASRRDHARCARGDGLRTTATPGSCTW